MLFYVENHTLIKVLRQQKAVMLKVYRRISQQAVDTVWIKETVAEYRNRRLPNTGHFTFFG